MTSWTMRSFACPDELWEAVEAYRVRLEEARGGEEVSWSEALRMVVRRGLAGL